MSNGTITKLAKYVDKLLVDAGIRTDLSGLTGAGLIGWTRSALSTSIGNAGQMLNTLPMNVWEKAYLITDKPNPADYKTWDWSPAFQAVADTGNPITIGPGEFLIKSPITFSSVLGGQGVVGAGMGVTIIRSPADIEFFVFTGSKYPVVADLTLESQNVATFGYVSHTKRHIKFVNCVRWRVSNVGIVGNSTTSQGSGIETSGVSSTMGLLENSIINHASFDCLTWDVHVKDCYIWANSKIYGLKQTGGIGNLRVSNTDFVPPLTSVVGRKASVYLTGAVTQPTLIGCYFDGNFSLVTGSGLLAENGVLNLLVSNCLANGHDEDVFVIDGCINASLQGNTFFNNNNSNTGASDILLQQTGAQPMEKPIVSGGTHTQSGTRTTPGPAIKVAAGVSRQHINIINNSIHQQGAGGGYTDIEIQLDDGYFATSVAGSLAGNSGSRTCYMGSGSSSVTAGATFQSISFTRQLAYAPRPDQLRIQHSTIVPGYRINNTPLPTVGGFGIGYPTGLPLMTVWYDVSL